MTDPKTPDGKVAPATKKAATKKAPAKKAPAKKKTTKKTAAKSLRAQHAASVAKVIYAKLKHKPVAQNFSTNPHVPSGSSLVDDLIGGSPAQDGKGPVCPGYPRRRITEVYGPESSGKTTLALQAIVSVQKSGGWAMFIDFEHALHHGYAKAIGVNFKQDQLLLYAPNTFEEGIRMLYMGILGGCDLIVVDSVAAMVPEAELKKPPGAPAKIGALAAEMANKLPKICGWLAKKNPKCPEGTAVIFINQIRAAISTGGGGRGGSENTSGGKALKFFAYLRLRLVRLRSDSIERTNKFTGKKQKFAYGNHTQVKVVKSKIDAKQGHTTDIFIRYGKGIDDYLSILEAAVANKIIERSGAYYHLEGERFQGRERIRSFLEGSPKVFAKIRNMVLKVVQAASIEAPPEIEHDEANLMSMYDAEYGDEDEAPDETIESLVEDDSLSAVQEEDLEL